jgi:hypothetical protein
MAAPRAGSWLARLLPLPSSSGVDNRAGMRSVIRMRKQATNAGTKPEEQRLHLHMRPPSPSTYRAPEVSPLNWVLIVVGIASASLILLGFLSLVLFAIIAGEPG